jgi:hypothetical protein
MTIAVAVSLLTDDMRSLLRSLHSSVARAYTGMPMPRMVLVSGKATEGCDVEEWECLVCDEPVPAVPERSGVWSPEYRLALAADCLRSRAYRLVGGPVWACDADVVVRKPFPAVDAAAALPVLDGGRAWRDVGMPWNDRLTTINCWYQACDLAEAFDRRFVEALALCDFPGEAAAYLATMDAGGVVMNPDVFDLAQGGPAGFRPEAHAWHGGAMKQDSGK